MKSRSVLCVLLLATGMALAADPPKGDPPKAESPKPEATKPEATKAGSPKGADEAPAQKKDAPDLGMSILGNQEAPKALVIVPWKSSEVGDSMGIATVLDDSRLPIDKEVFMRALSYFDIRSETTRHVGAMPATAAQGGKR